MTTRAAFSPEEWKVVLEGPSTAGMIVITAKACTGARAEHGDSELLDEIVAAQPRMEHNRYGSAEELRENGLGLLRPSARSVPDADPGHEADPDCLASER